MKEGLLSFLSRKDSYFAQSPEARGVREALQVHVSATG